VLADFFADDPDNLVHSAAGNVDAYGLAHQKGIMVVATASANDAEYLLDDVVKDVYAVIDLVGGETADWSYGVLKPGGVLVSAVVFEPSRESSTGFGHFHACRSDDRAVGEDHLASRNVGAAASLAACRSLRCLWPLL
jgi:NADPH:quinone reductase-like Zn-dependent oxidoreductase